MRDRLAGGPYLVVGCGSAGLSAAEALAARVKPSQILVWDVHDGIETRLRRARLAGHGVRVELGRWRPELLQDFSPATLIKSPGVAPQREPIRSALANGLTVIDELQLGVQLSRRQLIAVTGTDGKTTVCALLARALGDEMGSAVLAGNTEFGSPLSSLTPTGKPAVVEASSYQLEFCEGPFAQLAVLTNLTEEHLHRHQTMDDYGAAKRRLFLAEGRAVPLAAINVNGPFGDKLARELRDAGSTVATFGAAENAEYRVLAASWEGTGARIQVRTPTGNDLQISTQLPGWHNAENFVAALAGCELLGLSRPDALEALKTMRGVPGRWELIECGQPFDVVVDFAHSAAGLRQALLTARRIAAARAGAAVHLVLCAGGANNPGKRGALAAIASELADRVIVTEGNGRGEPAARVIAALLADWPSGGPTAEVISNRRAAIRQALRSAGHGDLVLVMGRGAMPRLLANAAGGGVEFDDRSVAEEELRSMEGGVTQDA